MSELAKRIGWASLLLLLILITSRSIFATPQTQVTTLEPGKPIDQTIAADETHSYTLTLQQGTYGLLQVDQKGTNLAVTVLSADGRKLRLADLEGPGVPEQLSLVATESTQYRVEVRIVGKAGKVHGYTIKLTDMRPATDQDRARLEGEKLLEDGMQLVYEQSAESARLEAVDKFQRSLDFFRTAKNQDKQAQGFYYLSYTFNLMAQFQKAQAAAEEGLPLAQAAGSRYREANLLDELGASFNYRGERKKGLDFFLRALPLRSQAAPIGLANTLNNVAMVYAWMGDSKKALANMEQAIAILRDTGDVGRESSILGNMCVTNTGLGQYKEALAQCNRALEIRRGFNDVGWQAIAVRNLGAVYAGLGDYQKALDFFQQSRVLYKSLNDREGEAMATNDVGWTYGQFGEYEKAIEFYSQVIQPFREQKNKYGEATALSNIAISYAKLNEFQKALELHLQVLPLRSEKDDPSGKAITLGNIAVCYAKLGDKQKALDYYTQALALHRVSQNQRQLAMVLRNFGAFLRDEKQTSKAIDYLNEARTISTAIGDRTTQASVLFELGRLELDRNNAVEARKLIEAATVTIESVRVNLKSPQLRTAFLASLRKYYEFEIEVLMRLHQQQPDAGYAAAALQVSEKSRARSLLELLREAHAEVRQGVDPALIERESTLLRMIGDKAEAQTRLLSGKYTEAQASATAKDLDALTDEYDQVQTRIRQASPKYAALVQPSPVGVEAIQKQVLDENTLLLEYMLGEQKSYVWAVTPDTVKVFELPGRATIESEAKGFYQLLAERSVTAEYSQAAASLSRMLVGPVAAELKQKRLVIVADGVLQYVPFSALPDQSAQPLIVEHEILTLPSASVLALLRDELANRAPASKAVAVLADPVFSASDSRLAKNSVVDEHSSPAGDVQRSAAESGLGGLVRLRFSRQEADEIARLAGDRRNLKALDFAANRTTATDPSLSDYRIVHFATHGLINNQHADLSGIVLSLVDEQGQPQNGFLRLYEIYSLKLNADLVVLSACQTALGKEMRGEGLVGLTRGFMYAGAPRVVASLWRIDDRATADIMSRFYAAMLKDGLRPAAALRAAQVSMSHDKRWHSPHYWAAFTLQGEWR